MKSPSLIIMAHSGRLLCLAVLALAAIPHSATAGAEDRTGEQIYQQRCASCHGKSGEGTEENYPKPLAGTKTVAQLARLIAKTMPKDADKKCTAAEADRVAAYIHEAFYSKAVQERSKPRIELSRLTVRQYRNAVADLIGSFPNPPPEVVVEKPGLSGEYYKLYGFRPNNRVFERTDPVVRFDFGEGSPDSEKIEPDRFCIRWRGAVLAPETGEYEFIVRTEHGAKLWINDLKRPLIDAFVKSGDSNEHRGSIFLVGGRAYPLRLEFAKGKQGDIDGKKDQAKPPPVKSSVALDWKLPNGAAEPIPNRNLSLNPYDETYVVSTPFPADDRSLGYERGTSVSKAWDQATTEAAISAADYVVRHLDKLAVIQKDAPDLQRARAFCLHFAERAFRRPLTAEQNQLYVHSQFEPGRDLEATVRRVVLFVLKSPRFLYREIGDSPDDYDVAARISFALLDSLPDYELRQAATKRELKTPGQVTHQVERLLGDPRARAKIRAFLWQWLKVDPAPELTKDAKLFPGFDAAIASDLRTSLELFLDDTVWGEASDFRQLLLDDSIFVNSRLARFYGADLPADFPFQKVALNSSARAGVLTHPYLMATFAYTQTSSPIHRGVFLARNVLGVSLPPPPDAFAPLAPDLHPKLTTRERVMLQTSPQNCITCHGVINPLGYTLEHYDAVGRYREKEKDRPLDTTGFYRTRAGKEVRFHGVRELATFLANSEEVHDAFVEKLFHHLIKQPIRAYGPKKLSILRRSFADSQYNIRKLIAAILAETALAGREVQPKSE